MTQLSKDELLELARGIADALDGEWTVEQPYPHAIRLTSATADLQILSQYPLYNSGKIEVHAVFANFGWAPLKDVRYRMDNSAAGELSMRATVARGPEAIAKDITRRILSTYEDRNNAIKAAMAAAEVEQAAHDAKVQRFVEILGGRPDKYRGTIRWSANDNSGNAEFELSFSGEAVDIKMTVPVQVAERIARLLVENT